MRELDFLNHTGNFRELKRKLDALGVPATRVQDHAEKVAASWFRLGEQHLADAAAAAGTRATYSRAYYAAYNASKALRYFSNGTVSLRGDDHAKAAVLPDDFPDNVSWSRNIVTLYEDRLRADYDNWEATSTEYNRPASEAIAIAQEFVTAARSYMESKFGLVP